MIYKPIGLTERNYDRIKQYAKLHKLSFGGAVNKLMDSAEIADIAPIVTAPELKPLHAYESFSLDPKPKRKSSINDQPW
jgi:hypothetical protein